MVTTSNGNVEDEQYILNFRLKLLKTKLSVLLQSNCLSLVELSSFQLVTIYNTIVRILLELPSIGADVADRLAG